MKERIAAVPAKTVDVVLDSDAFNEVDDQFALSYLLLNPQRARVKALYAAPFSNQRAKDPEEGMLKSHAEILKILKLLRREDLLPLAIQGSRAYLKDEKTPVLSPAAEDLARRAASYTPEDPLYIIAIGAITNVASAFLLAPETAKNTVVVWLGGHGYDFGHNREFNLRQDIAAARVVMQSECAFVQLPCHGVVSEFTVSKAYLTTWLLGKNALCDYLAGFTIRELDDLKGDVPWTKPLWDVTAVGWLLNDGDRYMDSRVIPARLPSYDGGYEAPGGKAIRYVYKIKRDELMTDLFRKLSHF